MGRISPRLSEKHPAAGLVLRPREDEGLSLRALRQAQDKLREAISVGGYHVDEIASSRSLS